MDVSQRVFRLFRTIAQDKLSAIEQILDQESHFSFNEKLKEWEKKYGIYDNESEKSHTNHSTSNEEGKTTGSYQSSNQVYPGYSDENIEDLKLFGLQPPSSFSEVKKIRNQEMKKFHPDKYIQSPDKMDVANQIVQIYNAAYERLKIFFDGK